MVLFAYGWSSYLAGVYNSLKHKLGNNKPKCVILNYRV